MRRSFFEAIVIGGSAGAMDALLMLFSTLPKDFAVPIIIAVHVHPSDDGELVKFFSSQAGLPIREAREKEAVQSNCIYLAPSNYHLLIEQDKTFSLSMDEKVNYARPSIDVLFESAALVFLDRLIGVLLTGANHDGAKGISTIKKYGGLTIAQDPLTAKYSVMPQAAIDTGNVDKILSVREISDFLKERRCHGNGTKTANRG